MIQESSSASKNQSCYHEIPLHHASCLYLSSVKMSAAQGSAGIHICSRSMIEGLGVRHRFGTKLSGVIMQNSIFW